MKETTSKRLNQIMADENLRQVDVLERCKPYCRKYGVKLNKNDLSQYVSGKVIPKQDKLSILALALNVNEVWLMGYNVPAGRDELSDNDTSLPDGIAAIANEYGRETAECVQMFVRLDAIDKGRIIGNMEMLLENDKYKQDGLKNA